MPEPTAEQMHTMRQVNQSALAAARAGGFDPYVFLDEYDKLLGNIGFCRSSGDDGFTHSERLAVVHAMSECGPPIIEEPVGSGHHRRVTYQSLAKR